MKDPAGFRPPPVVLLGALVVVWGGLLLVTRGLPANDASSPTTVEGPFAERLDRGKDLYFAGSYEEGERVLHDVAEEAASAGDHAARAEALTWLGNTARRTGRYAEARALGEQALELERRHGLRDQMPRTYIALGLLAWHEYRLADAADLHGSALELATELENEEAIAAATGNLGLVHSDLGDFARARADFRLFLEMGRQLDSLRYVANALTNLGMVATNTGEPATAVSFLLEALETYRRIENPSGEMKALGQLSATYQALGRPSDAFMALDSALALARILGAPDEEAYNLRDLGALHHTAGEHRRALERLREAGEIFEELGWGYEQGQVHRWMAQVHLELGSLEEGLSHARQALALHEADQAPLEALDDLALLAELESRRGRIAEATDRVREARELAGRLDVPAARVAAGLAGARVATRAGDDAEVLRSVSGIEADLESVGPVPEAEALALMARALRRSDRAPEAREVAGRAVSAVERVRGRFGSGSLRTSFLSGRSEIYGELIHALLDEGRVSRAFETSDRARGRGLFEHAVQSGSADSGSLGDLVRARELLARIDALVDRVDVQMDGGDPRTVERLRTDLREARSAYETVLLEAGERDAAGTAILGVRAVSARKIQEALRPGELLLEFFVGPDTTVAFAVSTDSIVAFRTAGGEAELASRVRVAGDVLADSTADRGILHPVLEGLHERLLGPVIRAGLMDGVGALVVVPHSALGYLPFAALRDPSSGRYLVQEVEISYAPSAGALPMLRLTGRAESEVGGAALFAPFPGELPGSRAEIDAIGEVLPRARRRAGRWASERRVRDALEAGELVHVASHGVMNPWNPMFSRIGLSRRSQAAEDDGRLEVHEVLAMRIRSPLVFLSGCETASGAAWSTSFARGEDYATLARAFLYAGADDVIATLWPVADRSAAVLSQRFYRHLNGDASPAASLALAQRSMIDEPAHASPYHWAPYRVAGANNDVRFR